jgi:hypothetical protein
MTSASREVSVLDEVVQRTVQHVTTYSGIAAAQSMCRPINAREDKLHGYSRYIEGYYTKKRVDYVDDVMRCPENGTVLVQPCHFLVSYAC